MDTIKLLKIILITTLSLAIFKSHESIAAEIRIQPTLHNALDFHLRPAQSSIIVRQALLESGFHRTLVTELNAPNDKTRDFTGGSFVLVQNITKDLYVDIDQLSSLYSLTGQPQVVVSEHMDTERPATLSSTHILLAYPQHTAHENWSVRLPIHYRYQTPCDSQYVSVTIPPPLLLYTPENGPRHSEEELSDVLTLLPCNSTSEEVCEWEQLDYRIVESTQDSLVYCEKEDCNIRRDNLLVAPIPCGGQDRMIFVVGITVLVSLLGAVFICITIGSI